LRINRRKLFFTSSKRRAHRHLRAARRSSRQPLVADRRPRRWPAPSSSPRDVAAAARSARGGVFDCCCCCCLIRCRAILRRALRPPCRLFLFAPLTLAPSLQLRLELGVGENRRAPGVAVRLVEPTRSGSPWRDRRCACRCPSKSYSLAARRRSLTARPDDLLPRRARRRGTPRPCPAAARSGAPPRRPPRRTCSSSRMTENFKFTRVAHRQRIFRLDEHTPSTRCRRHIR